MASPMARLVTVPATPPFFLVDGFDVALYPDIDGVERELEPYIDGLTLYDVHGSVLGMRVEGRKVRVDGEILGKNPGALEKALRGALLSPSKQGMFGRRRKWDVDVEKVNSATLTELVAIFMTTLGRK